MVFILNEFIQVKKKNMEKLKKNFFNNYFNLNFFL